MSKHRVVICQYCGKEARRTTGEEVYGEAYKHLNMLVCADYPWCDSYGSLNSLALANAPLRRARLAAHKAFDPLWQSGRMRRRKAYLKLADYMGTRPQDTHIGHFNEAQCARVLEFVQMLNLDHG